jgi:hypothetical protein
MSLGTAMAISGAAANPNMGYHSSRSVALLTTMFNVRLGWWLGNPGREGAETFTHEGPAIAIVPLIQEISLNRERQRAQLCHGESRLIGHIARGTEAAGALHVLRDHVRIAGQVAADMARHHASPRS